MAIKLNSPGEYDYYGGQSRGNKNYKEVSSLQFIHCCENVLVERAMLVGERPFLDMH